MNNRLQTDIIAWTMKPQSVDDAAFTGQVIDTADLMTGEIEIGFGTLAVALVALKLVESDVKASATALTGATTVKDFAAALPDDSQDGKFWLLNLARYLAGPHKRYLLLQATAGDGSGSKSDLVSIFRGCSRLPVGDGATAASDRGDDVDSVVYVDPVDPS